MQYNVTIFFIFLVVGGLLGCGGGAGVRTPDYKVERSIFPKKNMWSKTMLIAWNRQTVTASAAR